MSRPRLTGSRCECPTCGELFASTRPFDRHRIGSFDDQTRRCMSRAELVANRWTQTATGFWLTPDRRRAGNGVEGPRRTLPEAWAKRRADAPRNPVPGAVLASV